jgi:hypothetical protein
MPTFNDYFLQFFFDIFFSIKMFQIYFFAIEACFRFEYNK